MSNKKSQVGFSIADGFRLGIGFAIANALIALVAAIAWFMLLAGMLGAAR